MNYFTLIVNNFVCFFENVNAIRVTNNLLFLLFIPRTIIFNVYSMHTAISVSYNASHNKNF